MRKVYVPNKSHHDFKKAERFGQLVYLTDGVVNRFAVNQLYRECGAAMKDATAEDYILVSSLSILNAVAASIMAHRFGCVNFLVFDTTKRTYEPREILLSDRDVLDASRGAGE